MIICHKLTLYTSKFGGVLVSYVLQECCLPNLGKEKEKRLLQSFWFCNCGSDELYLIGYTNLVVSNLCYVRVICSCGLLSLFLLMAIQISSNVLHVGRRSCSAAKDDLPINLVMMMPQHTNVTSCPASRLWLHNGLFLPCEIFDDIAISIIGTILSMVSNIQLLWNFHLCIALPKF
ncbi:hypothetical protein RJT34_28003 [Clitoria ternatea]|uniref:Uncharacterized protein n=1 Tax=Clitoria ternatea TaxID=43366 RepID=A0AAN9FD69_CLITE